MNKLDTEYHSRRMDYVDLIYGADHMLPHRYVLVLTNLCNLRCSFCFQEKKKLAGSLTLNDWKNVIDQLPNYAHVTLTGGEPFLFKGFREIFEYITDRHTCNIISNGTLLSESLIDLLLSKDNFKVLSISVDNISNTLRDVNLEQWTKTEQMMRLFRYKAELMSKKTILDAKTVVLDENTEELFDIYKYCKETLKVDTHSFMLLKGHGIQHSDKMHPVSSMFDPSDAHQYSSPNDIILNFEKIRLYNKKNNYKSYVHPKYFDLNSKNKIDEKYAKFLVKSDHDPTEFLTCKAPWASVHINTNGSLFPCMAIEMGNVKRQTIPAIIFGEKYQNFKESIFKNKTTEGCNRCGYLTPKL